MSTFFISDSEGFSPRLYLGSPNTHPIQQASSFKPMYLPMKLKTAVYRNKQTPHL